jgi:hypothetical protein
MCVVQGEPFMEGLRANRPLLYAVALSAAAVLALATGLLPDLSAMFEIVYFPPDVSATLSPTHRPTYIAIHPRLTAMHTD